MADSLVSLPITSIDPKTGIDRIREVSGEINPVLFIHLLITDNFPQTELLDTCHVSYAVNNWPVKLGLSASHPSSTDSGPPVTPFPIGTGGGA